MEEMNVETTESVEQVENTENTEPNAEQTEETTEETAERTFTQSELDSIINKRLERERKSFQNNADLLFVNELAKSNGFNSTDEYREAVKKQQEQDKINQLVAQNLPKEVAEELIEGRKFREETKAERAKQEKDQQTLKEFMELSEEVEEIKQASDVKPEVWQLQKEKEISLLDAYNRIENKNLKAQLETIKLQTEQETINKITKNATSPGSASSGNVDHNTKWSAMSDADFAKQVELAKQGMLT